jgi:hypothetical protein
MYVTETSRKVKQEEENKKKLYLVFICRKYTQILALFLILQYAPCDFHSPALTMDFPFPFESLLFHLIFSSLIVLSFQYTVYIAANSISPF